QGAAPEPGKAVWPGEEQILRTAPRCGREACEPAVQIAPGTARQHYASQRRGRRPSSSLPARRVTVATQTASGAGNANEKLSAATHSLAARTGPCGVIASPVVTPRSETMLSVISRPCVASVTGNPPKREPGN